MKFVIDNLMILLSADWFLPVWSACGMHSELGVRIKLQTACQASVEAMLGGADVYWDVEFSESRSQKTASDFDQALKRANVSEADVSVMRAYIEGATEGEASLFMLILSDSLNDHALANQLGEQTISELAAICAECDGEPVLISAADSKPSKWDSYLISLTPDQPTFMLDSARELARYGTVPRLVQALRTALAQDKFDVLMGFLQNSAQQLVGRTFLV